MTATETVRRALVEAVCRRPDDDTLRRRFADHLAAGGDARDDAWAALIRVQLALAPLGPPRVRFGFDWTGPCTMSPHGPDYWQFTALPEPLTPGDRVDVRGRIVTRSGGKVGRVRDHVGLVVVRARDLGNDGADYVVKRDAGSGGPWAGAAGAAAERDLLARLAYWWPLPVLAPYTGPPERLPAGCAAAHFHRGFVRTLYLHGDDWVRRHHALAWHPGPSHDLCPTCAGAGVHPYRLPHPADRLPDWVGPSCTACDRRGVVPRPCPATAQPLAAVVLVTPPATEWFDSDMELVRFAHGAPYGPGSRWEPCRAADLPGAAENDLYARGLCRRAWPWLSFAVRGRPDAT